MLNAADIGLYADLGTRPEGVISLPYRDDRLVIVAPRRGASLAGRRLHVLTCWSIRLLDCRPAASLTFNCSGRAANGDFP